MSSVTDNESGNSFDGSSMGITLALLPATIIGVYAFVEKAAVLSAITALFGGASNVALAVTTALWIVGGVTLGFIAVIIVASVIALLAGIAGRSALTFGAGLLGSAWAIASYVVGVKFFSALPVAVAFVLASNALIYGAFVIIAGLLFVAVAIGVSVST